MLQLMLDAKDETGGEKIDNDDILAQSLVFLLAGYETSSTTLGFVCYLLAIDTHVQDKLREEIDRMWPGDEVGSFFKVGVGIRHSLKLLLTTILKVGDLSFARNNTYLQQNTQRT